MCTRSNTILSGVHTNLNKYNLNIYMSIANRFNNLNLNLVHNPLKMGDGFFTSADTSPTATDLLIV